MKKRIDHRMAADLINTGRTHARDFYSAKTGKTFEADLLMKIEEDGKVSFQMEFPKRAGFLSKATIKRRARKDKDKIEIFKS